MFVFVSVSSPSSFLSLFVYCMSLLQLNSRDEPEKTFKVAMPDNAYSTVYLRDAMSVEEFLASACARRNLNPMEHFVRVKKRRDMEDHNYFVPHRNDLIENYVSSSSSCCCNSCCCCCQPKQSRTQPRHTRINKLISSTLNEQTQTKNISCHPWME